MENDKVYMGIDPGSKGFISIQKYSKFSFYSIEDNDLYQLSKIMANLRSNNSNMICVIEDVHAVHGSAAGTTFTFGFNKGYLIGLLAANNIPYVLIQPKIWQTVSVVFLTSLCMCYMLLTFYLNSVIKHSYQIYYLLSLLS